MAKSKRSDAQRRNWGKFMVCGIKGQLNHINTGNFVLSEHEREHLERMEQLVDGLVDNWDKGTHKIEGIELEPYRDA